MFPLRKTTNLYHRVSRRYIIFIPFNIKYYKYTRTFILFIWNIKYSKFSIKGPNILVQKKNHMLSTNEKFPIWFTFDNWPDFIGLRSKMYFCDFNSYRANEPMLSEQNLLSILEAPDHTFRKFNDKSIESSNIFWINDGRRIENRRARYSWIFLVQDVLN